MSDFVGGSEFLVNTTTAGDQRASGIGTNAGGGYVTALADGGFLVAWWGNGTVPGQADAVGVFLQRYDSTGARVGTETRVNSHTAGHQQSPALAALADGGYVVAWVSVGQDGSGSGIYAQRHDAAGAKVGPETLVNTTTAGNQQYPTVAALADGGFVVTWQSPDAKSSAHGVGVYAQRYDRAGARVGKETRINSTMKGFQYYSSVAGLADGGYLVTWWGEGKGDAVGIFAQRYNAAGAKVGKETRVNSTTKGGQYFPAIAALAGGGYVVTWHGAGLGDTSGVFAQRHDADGAKVGPETLVNTTTAGQQHYPAVAALADGGYVVAWWGEGKGDTSGVFAQRYDADGAAVGSETLVNTTTRGSQQYPAVTGLANGSYVVAWESSGQDASGTYGVYARIFTPGSVPVVPAAAPS